MEPDGAEQRRHILTETKAMSDKRNLFNKVWDLHTVRDLPGGQTQLFIGLHMIHEVTSPQAFEILRDRKLKVAFPNERLRPSITSFRPPTRRVRFWMISPNR